MVCTDTEIGLVLDLENNSIRICITSGAAEIKKSRKRIFFFFLICPNLESAGLRNYLSKNSGLSSLPASISLRLSFIFPRCAAIYKAVAALSAIHCRLASALINSELGVLYEESPVTPSWNNCKYGQ